MRIQLSGESVLRVALFYPSNSLMHQVSSWVGENPACDFKFCFPGSLPEIRIALRRRAVSIMDATDDLARPPGKTATAAFLHAISVAGADSVALYTEMLHDGLELLVRSRGALLLLGPMSDALWERLFETVGRNLDLASRHALPAWQPTGTGAASAAAWLPSDRLESSANNRFRRTA